MTRLAWRNLWRNGRRSALTILSVSCGLAAVMLAQSLMKTLQRQMVAKSTGIMLGHLQAQAAGVKDRRAPELAYPRPARFEAALRADPRVRAVSARLVFTGLAYSPSGSRGALVVGVEPATEPKLSILPGYLRRGRYLGAGPRDLVLGDTLAGNLDVRVGEKLVLMTQGKKAEMASELFRVAGIYHSGSESYDGQVVYVPLEAAQRLRAVPGKVSYLVATLHAVERIGEVERDLGPWAAAEGGELVSFRKIGREVEGIIRFEDAILAVILVVIFAIVGLGILNTVAMSMFERVREFGVLRALGARPATVVRMIGLEALMLGALGAALGLALGLGFIGYWGVAGLHLPVGKALSYWIPFESVIYLRPIWELHLGSAALLVLVSLVSAAGPAFRASRLVVAQALRSL